MNNVKARGTRGCEENVVEEEERGERSTDSIPDTRDRAHPWQNFRPVLFVALRALNQLMN
jgi:hypothetical protein